MDGDNNNEFTILSSIVPFDSTSKSNNNSNINNSSNNNNNNKIIEIYDFTTVSSDYTARVGANIRINEEKYKHHIIKATLDGHVDTYDLLYLIFGTIDKAKKFGKLINSSTTDFKEETTSLRNCVYKAEFILNFIETTLNEKNIHLSVNERKRFDKWSNKELHYYKFLCEIPNHISNIHATYKMNEVIDKMEKMFNGLTNENKNFLSSISSEYNYIKIFLENINKK